MDKHSYQLLVLDLKYNKPEIKPALVIRGKIRSVKFLYQNKRLCKYHITNRDLVIGSGRYQKSRDFERRYEQLTWLQGFFFKRLLRKLYKMQK